MSRDLYGKEYTRESDRIKADINLYQAMLDYLNNPIWELVLEQIRIPYAEFKNWRDKGRELAQVFEGRGGARMAEVILNMQDDIIKNMKLLEEKLTAQINLEKGGTDEQIDGQDSGQGRTENF